MFKGETSSLSIFKNGVFKNVPTINDGGKVRVKPEAQEIVKDFLLDRDHDLEEFEPKKLNDEQNGKISEIINFLTGKVSSSFSTTKTEATPSSDDFDFEETFTSKTTTTTSTMDSDDFFSDLN